MGRNHYGTNTGKAFRLSVCLKRFFSDERARCFITADTGLRFRWLAARMRRLFGLSGPFCLVSRGHLLPPDEPVGLLSPNDLVEVIPKHYKMFPDTSESSESEIMDLFGSDDEKPKNSNPVSDIPPKQAAKEDQHNHEKTSHETVNYQSSNSAISEQIPTETQNLQEVQVDDLQNKNSSNKDKAGNGKLEEVENQNLEAVKRKALELLDQCSNPLKRKRKRVRRRKRCTANQESEDDAETEDVNDGPERPPTSDTCSVAAGENDVSERSPSSQHADSLILRNNLEHSRAARIVHSLL